MATLGKFDKQYRNFQTSQETRQPIYDWERIRGPMIANQNSFAKSVAYNPYAATGDLLGKLWAAQYMNRGINKGEDTARGILSDIRMGRYANDPNPEQTARTADQTNSILKYNAAPVMANMSDDDIRQTIIAKLKSEGRSANQIEQVLKRVEPTIKEMRSQYDTLQGENAEKALLNSWNTDNIKDMAQSFSNLQKYDPNKANIYAKIWAMQQQADIANKKNPQPKRIRGGRQAASVDDVKKAASALSTIRDDYVAAHNGEHPSDEWLQENYPNVWAVAHDRGITREGVDIDDINAMNYAFQSAKAYIDRERAALGPKPTPDQIAAFNEKYRQTISSLKELAESPTYNDNVKRYYDSFPELYDTGAMKSDFVPPDVGGFTDSEVEGAIDSNTPKTLTAIINGKTAMVPMQDGMSREQAIEAYKQSLASQPTISKTETVEQQPVTEKNEPKMLYWDSVFANIGKNMDDRRKELEEMKARQNQ